MDFKALMASQIAKAKSTSSVSTSTKASVSSKYLRRGDLEARRQTEYAEEQARLKREREERTAKKRRLEDEEAEQNAIREAKMRRLAEESKIRREGEAKEEEHKRRKRLGLPALPEDEEQPSEDFHVSGNQLDISEEELQAKLREINEPVRLFDEDHESKLKRYYKLVSTTVQKAIRTTGPIPTTLLPVSEKDMLLPSTVPSRDSAEHQFIRRQLASYFSLLLTEWKVSLSGREAAIKESQTGRAAFATYQTVLHDLTPLFRKLESDALPSDLLNPLIEITHNIQARRYVDANNGYLRLSIGKAAWPIGVTMVGIHERSARERIHDGGEDKAHIMSDEVTRKMLQSVKRCLSYAQTRWPPDDIGQLMG